MEIGDRVRYTGASFGSGIKVVRGREGVITYKGNQMVTVKLDGATGLVAIHKSNLEAV